MTDQDDRKARRSEFGSAVSAALSPYLSKHDPMARVPAYTERFGTESVDRTVAIAYATDAERLADHFLEWGAPESVFRGEWDDTHVEKLLLGYYVSWAGWEAVATARERLKMCISFVRITVSENASKALSYKERKAIVRHEIVALCEQSEMSPRGVEVAMTKWFTDVLVRVALQELMDEGALQLDAKLLLRAV